MCIIFNSISKSFGNTKVFQDFNLAIKGNQTTCILGASGIGKTTLLNLLLGIEKVDCGSIDGLAGKNIVAVFQENRLVENLTSIKNVQLVCKKNFSKVELMDDFKKDMKDVYTTTLSKETIDESPRAYRSINEIAEQIKDTVKIKFIIKPIYNYKG